MKKIIGFLCYLLLITGFVFAQDINHDMISPTKNKNAAAAYKEGTSYYQSRDFEKAEELFKKALKLDSNFLDAANFLGLIYYNQNKKVEAIRTFEKAIKDAKRLKVSDIMLHLNLALAYESNAMFDNAVDAYNHVIKNAPDNPEGHYGLALLLYNNGREIYALRFFKNALDLYMAAKSEYALSTLHLLASSYYNIGDYNSAKICYNNFKDTSILKEYGISQEDIDTIKTAGGKEKAAAKKAKFKFQKYGLKVAEVPYLKEIEIPKKFGISLEKAFEFTDGSGVIYYTFAKENKGVEIDSVYAFIHQTAQKLAGKEPALFDIYSSRIIQDADIKKYLGADLQILDILADPTASNLKGYKHFLVNAIYQKDNGVIFQIILLKGDDFDLNKLYNSYTLCGF